MIIIHLHIKG